MDEKQNKVLWDAVRQEDDLQRAIALAADVGEAAVVASLRDRENIREQLAGLRVVIMGDGDPSCSLMNRVKRIEEDVNSMKTETKEITTLLRGDLKGGESLLEEIRRQRTAFANMSKLGWAVLIALVIEFVVQLVKMVY